MAGKNHAHRLIVKITPSGDYRSMIMDSYPRSSIALWSMTLFLGDRFSPKAFHVLFIKQGTIRVGYFREALLKGMGKAEC